MTDWLAPLWPFAVAVVRCVVAGWYWVAAGSCFYGALIAAEWAGELRRRRDLAEPLRWLFWLLAAAGLVLVRLA